MEVETYIQAGTYNKKVLMWPEVEILAECFMGNYLLE
jgi:hypothetical protein